MAAQNFAAILRRVLQSEGGYVNHPSDPGGPTNYGITLATYRRFVEPDATAADIRSMPIETAMQIYRKRYWDACGCDQLPSGVDYSVMDYAVNSGNGRANGVLRHVIGLAPTASLGRVAEELAKRDALAIINAINDERLAFLKTLRTWPVFGAGWLHRVNGVRVYSRTIAHSSADDPKAKAIENMVPASVGKAEHTVSKTAQGGAAAPAVVAAGSGAIIAPDWFASHPLFTVVIALLIIVAVAGVIAIIIGRNEKKQLTPMPIAPVLPTLPQGGLFAGKVQVTGNVAELIQKG
jgi:lysozyme family protein